jgi:phage replication-related protein YjqB (UPF0714/DUF867 family)
MAVAIAADDHCLYLFEGRKPTGNWDLHITSTRFDEPRCLALISGCDRVVAVHGWQGEDESVYIGGLDPLRDSIQSHLEAVGIATGIHADPNMQGTNSNNICNRGRLGRGVQLEITSALRARFRRNSPPEFLAKFAAAVRGAIETADWL